VTACYCVYCLDVELCKYFALYIHVFCCHCIILYFNAVRSFDRKSEINHQFSSVCAIFNACIQQGCCPKVWKMADVLPISKVHPPMSVQSDLRPISPTATISKHLEAIVGQWILTYVSDQIDKRQYGSLKGRSTTHALIDIVHH